MISELKNLKNIFADYKELLKKYNNNEFADYVEVENDFDAEVPF
jgi:predicted translin family RNA/ssDNA-binding protein